MSVFYCVNNKLFREFDGEKLCIETWGKNSLRVRATYLPQILEEDWALLKTEEYKPEIKINEEYASIKNGKITAIITKYGKITYFNSKGDIFLEEYVRTRNNHNEYCSALNIDAREFKAIPGADYELTVRFESDPNEKIFGMGQYQIPFLNLKNCTLELAHRNSQVSIPFMLSNKGCGFLWNNPAVGSVSFSKNITYWYAKSTKQMDYWITFGDSPSEIEENYARVTGTPPKMPEDVMGLWQSKLRYQTQEELIKIVCEYESRNIPLDVIVVDFFHWTKHGEWKFDSNYWPDPEHMVRQLSEKGVKVAVSIWPTVEKSSENYNYMLQKGYLVRVDRGVRTTLRCIGDTIFIDPTNPECRAYVWDIVKKNYYDKGIKIFWLDEAEPEYEVYDYDNYRYFIGTHLQVGNIYPLLYAKAFFEGQAKQGQKDIINLVRCGWAGSQRYGVLIWSGDIDASFESLKIQIKAGLNIALAGIPWWTTDIGGFHGGRADDPDYRECIIRWFQYATFCPILRMHGYRLPYSEAKKDKDGGMCGTGADNEVWCYGEEAYEIFKKYIGIRQMLRPYIVKVMEEAHLNGTPPMRPLFYDFPQDMIAWDIEDQFMFGPDLLVVPVAEKGCKNKKVYLPFGSSWREINTMRIFEGGNFVEIDTPLSYIPVFTKNDKKVW